jgi:preprotein translocase subunit SecE
MFTNLTKRIEFIPRNISRLFLELRQVDFLSRKRTIRYTLITVVTLALGTISLIIVDRILIELRNLLLNF